MALLMYDKLRTIARLPIEMTVARVLAVLAITLAMATASALLAVRKVGHADPADLF
jgi:putative ABC transport system permease protein